MAGRSTEAAGGPAAAPQGACADPAAGARAGSRGVAESEEPRPGESGAAPLRVAQLVEALRGALGELFGEFWVEGELGAIHRSRPGHLYFELSEGEARLPAVLFASSARFLAFEPCEGMQVRARACFDLYAPQGRLQLRVRALVPAGEGSRRRALEQLRRSLEAEGLFAPERKRPLPFWPRAVGLVTSLRGAALHDFVRAAQRRAAPELLLVCDARVQGEGAWRELVRALHWLDADPRVEVIVLARGGGSAEDLWAFNREELVRAIAELRTPVISAIGHEVDWVLTDLVADARAATPTAAAALCLPEREPLVQGLERALRRLRAAQGRRLRELRQQLQALQRGLVHPAQRLRALRQALQTLSGRLRGARSAAGRARAQRVAALAGRLDALSPLRVLGRGYSIAFDAGGRAVRSSAELAVGAPLALRFAQGSAQVRVESLDETLAPEPAAEQVPGGGVRGATSRGTPARADAKERGGEH